jgi:hypothetical protein
MDRGGSWNNNHRNVRCANRNRNVPDNFNNNIGFRLVVHDSYSFADKVCPLVEADEAPISEPAPSVPGNLVGYEVAKYRPEPASSGNAGKLKRER